jgi:putative transposase
VGQRRHGKLLLVAENRTERIGRKVYRTRDAARADVFDYIERFYNTIRRLSTNGYLSPVEFERKVGLA